MTIRCVINIENFNEYGAPAQHLIRTLGIAPERYAEFSDWDLYRSLGLSKGVFFDRETFGADRLVPEIGQPSWPEFLAKAPLSEIARRDIAMLHETRVDYLAGLNPAEKSDRLRGMSYQDYLLDVVGIQRESLAILKKNGYWAIGIDALSARTAASSKSK